MRFYHDGSKLSPPIVQHPQFGPSVEWPPLMCPIDPGSGNHVRQFKACEPGSILLALPGHGFWAIAPGGFIDLPNELTPATVKANAPHLLTESEALEKGIAVRQPETIPAPKPSLDSHKSGDKKGKE